MDELRGMVTFARVVESGSFAEAARKSGVGRAAISHQVKQLEERLGVRLLHRSTRSLSLTHAGQDYYQSCKIIADEAEAASRRLQALSSEPTGRVSITCSTNYGLKRIVPLLSSFRQLYPKVELEVELTDQITNLIEGGYDLAIRAGPLQISNMMARKLCSVQRVICATPAYLEQFGRPANPEELANHNWVVYSRQTSQINLVRDGQQVTIRVNGPVHTNNAGARLQFVLGGHGLGLLPEHELWDLPEGTLEVLLPDYQLAPLDLFAVYPPGAASSLKVRMLIDYLALELPKSGQQPAEGFLSDNQKT
ncbi:LysR family transcriptional regulator [Kiloniella laminariae]|uniref:LysR family transcriptional regulator n=1 Tax=Kiloniella laminariae TaxID=454162 RepID=UPI00035E48CF|nr:LysR family transcriptional regulator [Kiloniella laminariae]